MALRLLDSEAVALDSTLTRPKGGIHLPRRLPTQPPPNFTRRSRIVDSSTLLRRTPAGDDEVARPANGLSITQRRILTLLDAPGRLGELPLGSGIDGERMQREAARLARAGLIVFETQGNAHKAVAANAADLRRSGMPLARPLAAIAMLAVVGAIVWVGRQFSAPPAAANGPRASTSVKPVRINAEPVPAEPPVFATRVLRSDPRPAAPSPKAPTETAAAAAPPTQAAPRAEP